jgi:hypothetical protein
MPDVHSHGREWPAWPILAVAALMLAGLVGTATLAWRPGEFNIAEAAALHDAGEVQRLLWLGADPRAPQRVRGMLVRRAADLHLTPMEAAVMRRRDDVALVLLSAGAVAHAGEAARLRCLAIVAGGPDIARLLEERFALPDDECPAVPPPWE